MKLQVVVAALAALGISACASVPASVNTNPVCSTEPTRQEAQLCQANQQGARPDNGSSIVNASVVPKDAHHSK